MSDSSHDLMAKCPLEGHVDFWIDLQKGNSSHDVNFYSLGSQNCPKVAHEADVTFTRDRKTVYFTRSNYFERKYKKDSLGINRLKIFKATQDTTGEWSIISDLPFNNDNYSVGHPTISEDQKTLYFVSDMPGSLGKTDIFKVAINDDGTYDSSLLSEYIFTYICIREDFFHVKTFC